MLVQKGYLRFDERPTRTVEAHVLEDVEDIAASIPIPFVRDAMETAGLATYHFATKSIEKGKAAPPRSV